MSLHVLDPALLAAERRPARLALVLVRLEPVIHLGEPHRRVLHLLQPLATVLEVRRLVAPNQMTMRGRKLTLTRLVWILG